MTKANELFREFKTAHKAWENAYKLPIATRDIKKKPNELTYKEWSKIESQAAAKTDEAVKRLYSHLKKHGLKMTPVEFEYLAFDSVDSVSQKNGQGKPAKAKMKALLTTIGKNEIRTRSKYKLPSQSQLSRGCGRR